MEAMPVNHRAVLNAGVSSLEYLNTVLQNTVCCGRVLGMLRALCNYHRGSLQTAGRGTSYTDKIWHLLCFLNHIQIPMSL